MDQFSLAALQKEIGRHYRMAVTEMKPQGPIWKITAPSGSYVLKLMHRSPAELQQLTIHLKKLHQNGFQEIVTPVPTIGGDSFFGFAGRNYILLPFIHGASPSFSNRKHQERVASLYARFHEASFQATASNDVSLLSWVEEYTARIRFLQACLHELADSPRLNRIDRAVQRWGNYYLRQADYALKGLERACETRPESAGRGIAAGFCHNDPAPRNIIMQDRKWYLIDFELAGINLFIKELATLLLRVLSANAWQPESVIQLLDSYCKIRPLPDGELEILPFLLCFPQKFWRFCSQRYLEKLDRGEHFYQEKIWSLVQEEALRRKALQVWSADFCNDAEEEYDVRLNQSGPIDGDVGLAGL